MENPFKGPRYGDMQTYQASADDRIHAVKSFDQEQCHAALKLSDLQKTVEKAVHARLRKLEQETR